LKFPNNILTKEGFQGCINARTIPEDSNRTVSKAYLDPFPYLIYYGNNDNATKM
jgi:hypothetical protein